MEVFENTGHNYLPRYARFKHMVSEIVLDNPVEHYCTMSQNDIKDYKKELFLILKDMEFFSVSKVSGRVADDYLKLLERADKDIDDYLQRYKDKEKENQKIQRYFSFKAFDNIKANQIFEDTIKNLKKGDNCYFVNGNLFAGDFELLDGYTFMVYIYKKKEIVSIGYTRGIKTYINERIQKRKRTIDCDKMVFCQVPNEFKEYVYIESCKYFNKKFKTLIKTTDAKYTTFKLAKAAYKYRYGLTESMLKRIIYFNDLEEFHMLDGIVLDKIELDKCVNEYINIINLKK